jgi:hypothetical protein
MVRLFPTQGGGSVHIAPAGYPHEAIQITSDHYVTDDGMRLANPDGPAAADHIEHLERTMERCALIVDRNLYHQHEKIEDVPRLLRAALSKSREDQS